MDGIILFNMHKRCYSNSSMLNSSGAATFMLEINNQLVLFLTISIWAYFNYFFKDMFLILFVSLGAHTMKREGLMPSYFDFCYYFDCRRGFRNLSTTNFRINIQSAKSCMTSDVMQQFLIDLIFSPYALQAMLACIVNYNTHNSAQFCC